jgi:predicted alpha-1,2-mannosidase
VAPAMAAPAPAPTDLASYVNPFVGTKDGGTDFGHGGGAGMNFPGAVLPFGMMQWSPDTVRTSGGGYKYEDNRLRGFSLTHINGPGCTGAQDFPVVPITGTIQSSPATHGDAYVQTFSHANEQASPGHYSVTLDSGVKTELTATTRAGVGRFTFPTSGPGTLLLNVTGSINGVEDAEARIDGNTVSGWARTGGFCGAKSRYYVYFHATFDRPFQAYGTWKNDWVQPGEEDVRGKSAAKVPPQTAKIDEGVNPVELRGRTAKRKQAEARTEAARSKPRDVIVKGPGSGVYLQFDTSKGRAVQMRVGLSYVSVDGAKRNLRAEVGSKGLAEVRDAARRTWNSRLAQITTTGGTPEARRTFYTALYHAFLQPYVFDDVDGRYTGFDSRTHTVRKGHHHYATFSGWDIYRSEAQLLAFLAPDVASDIAQTLYDDAHSIGDVWDRWSHQNTITGVMNGDPYHSIIASAYAFGARDFTAQSALASMVKGARRVGMDTPTGYEERPGNADYLKYGYVPGDVATTLEYNIADFGIAQLAQRLGDTATYQDFMKRSQGWQNLFNPANGWIQPRFADGSFLTPFDPADASWYVEGNGAQYHWMVQHNVRALFNSMGGRDAAAKRLDTFFTELNAGSHRPYAYLGNEPSLQSPWLYAWAGTPYKTADVVRRAQKLIWKPTPDGLVGNDDLGTMSAWYVWASLGMYPVTPGRADLVLNSPLFTRAVVKRSSGQVITINAPGASDTSYYVQSLKVDGKRSTRSWLPESFVAKGGTLDYVLGSRPDTSFGSNPADAPPSYSEGQRSFLSSVDPGLAPVQPGETVAATLQAQAIDKGDTLTWSAKPPAGVTVTPASGTLTLAAEGKASQAVSVTVARGTPLGLYSTAFELRSASGAVVSTAGLQLNVAKRGTVEWYANNAGISDDARPDAANFDGGGWSYSAQALAAEGIKPGGSVSWRGLTFTWPNRKPGELDNLVAGGQTVELGAPQAAGKLAFVGSGSNGDAPSTVTVTYTDGSTKTAPLAFSDWALGADRYPPQFGNEVVAKMTYRNAAGTGQQKLNVYIFGATPIDLDPGKQVKSFTLPAPQTGGALHVFGWAFGS